MMQKLQRAEALFLFFSHSFRKEETSTWAEALPADGMAEAGFSPLPFLLEEVNLVRKNKTDGAGPESMFILH